MKRLYAWIFVAVFIGLGMKTASAQQQDLALWYEQPAQEWTEALPIGNGSLGAMIFGNVQNERIQLNEESVWTGHPIERANPEAREQLDKVRELLFDGNYEEAERLAQQKIMGKRLQTGTHTYQTLGNLQMQFPGGADYSEYHRELDLNDAITRVSYKQDGISYSRELFSSYPDQALVMNISADQPGKTSFNISINRPGEGEERRIESNTLVMQQQLSEDGLRYVARLAVLPADGSVTPTDTSLSVTDADEVTVILTAATDYQHEDPAQLTQSRLKKAAAYSYRVLRERHKADYQRLAFRSRLDITPGEITEMPTDRRLEHLREGQSDLNLTELYYQFGRYLLISSSRPGSLPANLQGIWAEGLAPPWNADYHININLQMNYWPADLTNLSETGSPFYKFVESLNKRGRETAQKVYGSRGTVAHHTTDLWQFTDPIGQTYYGMWPMGMAWLSMHFWDHYQFTKDQSFLRDRAYPQLKEASLFFIDYMVEDPETGHLVTGPSMSPENQFITPNGNRASVTMGPTMDMQIVQELFTATVKAAKSLETDPDLTKILEEKLENLAPTQIGSDGTIMEWRRDFDEADPGHRHISHLYSLHPGNAINDKETPELLEAAGKTIERRLENGGGHTGWSRAWIINFFSRLKNAEKAHENLVALFEKSTLPNLFDTHPPFQIDGNFGGTAGIAEMLLQSHAGYTDLLPALPSAWPEGMVSGLRARGGLTIDISWSDHRLQEAVVESEHDGTYEIQYQGQSLELNLKSGEKQIINPQSF